MFASEGELLLTNKKRELQRYIDAVLGDGELARLPCVVKFFELDKRYDYTIPRMTIAKWTEVMGQQDKEPYAEYLHKEYSKIKLENATLQSRIQELIQNEAIANMKAGSLTERVAYYKEAETLHEREMASIRAWAAGAVAALKDQLASKQQEIDVLIRSANTLEEDNVRLRSELSVLRETAAARGAALDAKTQRCTALEKRVAELEAACAVGRSAAERAARELELWREQGTNVSSEAGLCAAKWKEALEEVEAAHLRSERLAERVRTLEALGVTLESTGLNNGDGNISSISISSNSNSSSGSCSSSSSSLSGNNGRNRGFYGGGAQGRDLELRLEAIGARNSCANRERRNEIQKLLQGKREVEVELNLIRRELELVRAEGKKTGEQVDALRAERERDFEHYLSLDPVVKKKEAEIRTLNGSLFQQELLIWLLEFQNRELLQEVGSLTLALDKAGEAPKETERTRLMYSGQYLEGLDALEIVEKQNAYMKDQVHKLNAELSRNAEKAAADIAIAHADLERCRLELDHEHERAQRLALLASKNGLHTEDTAADEFTAVLDLRKTIAGLQAEIGDIKQRYFFYLAMTIKLQTNGTCQLDELYNELLEDKSVTVDGWSKWINQKMRASLNK